MKKITLSLLAILASLFQLNAQLYITQGISPESGVQNVLLGTGVSISNINYSGVANSFGTFTSGPNATNLGLTSGVIMSTGKVSGAAGISNGATVSTDNGTSSDVQLASIASGIVNDAAVLEFDFIPLSDTVLFRYVFASEEYTTYVNTTFNDVFGFWISGPNPSGGIYTNQNIALIPGTTLPVAINNLNNGTSNSGPCEYCQYYINNSPSNLQIAYNAMTTVLTAIAKVVPCQTYHIKIAIGDVGDHTLDSGVFLEANSFTSPGMNAELHFNSTIRENTVVEGCSDANIVFRLPQTYPDDVVIHYSTGGNAERDVDYTIFPNVDSLVIVAGADTGFIHITAIQDNVTDIGDTIYIIIPSVGCSNLIDTIKIPIVDNSPILLNVAEDQLLCDGGMGFLTVSATQGVSPYTYSWSNGAGNIVSQDVFPTVTTTYVVSATDLCNNLSVDSIKVVIGSLMYTTSNDTTVCSGTPLTLESTFDGNVTWAGYNTNPIDIIANQTNIYRVTMNNVCGTVNDSVIVNVYQNPNLSLGPNSTFCDYETYNLSLNQSYEEVSWYYSTDATTMGSIVSAEPTYTASTTGIYYVVARNGFCYDTTMVLLSFIPCEINAPNIITPNSDGFNDFFKFTNLEYYNGSKLMIYNRWGRKVYSTNDYRNDWDGNNLIDGIYYYVLTLPSKVRLEGSEDWIETLSGSITILR